MRAKNKYTVVGQEEGRGRPFAHSFSTLLDAARYVESHYQGPEYIDCASEFHSDYSTFQLRGFTFNDIGTLGFDADCCRTFRFKATFEYLDASCSDSPLWIVECDPDSMDCPYAHYQCTPAYAARAIARNDGSVGFCGSEAEYVARFGKAPVSEISWIADVVPHQLPAAVCATTPDSELPF